VSARCTVVRWSTITAARVCCVLYSAAERGTAMEGFAWVGLDEHWHLQYT
jgi:hypothetical protein